MQLQDLLGKTCVIGLRYFGLDGAPLKQSQCCGTVVSVDKEQGIGVQLQHRDPGVVQPILSCRPTWMPGFAPPPAITGMPRAAWTCSTPSSW